MTGVQTCALPICGNRWRQAPATAHPACLEGQNLLRSLAANRSGDICPRLPVIPFQGFFRQCMGFRQEGYAHSADRGILIVDFPARGASLQVPFQVQSFPAAERIGLCQSAELMEPLVIHGSFSSFHVDDSVTFQPLRCGAAVRDPDKNGDVHSRGVHEDVR